MKTAFLKTFRPGQMLREVLDRININRIYNILESIEGIGCTIEKPLDADGLGWKIVVDPRRSDLEGPERHLRPHLPMDVVEGKDGMELYRMPTTASDKLGAALVVKDKKVSGSFTFVLNISKGSASLSIGGITARDHVAIPVATVEVKPSITRVIQLFHGNGGQFRLRGFDEKTLDWNRTRWGNGPAAQLYRWHDKDYLIKVKDNAPFPQMDVAVREVPVLKEGVTREDAPCKLYHVKGSEFDRAAKEEVTDKTYQSIMVDPDEAVKEAVNTLILNFIYSEVKPIPQSGKESGLHLFLGVVVDVPWYGAWQNATADALLGAGAASLQAVNALRLRVEQMEKTVADFAWPIAPALAEMRARAEQQQGDADTRLAQADSTAPKVDEQTQQIEEQMTANADMTGQISKSEDEIEALEAKP